MALIEWTPKERNTPEGIPGIVDRVIQTKNAIRVEFSNRKTFDSPYEGIIELQKNTKPQRISLEYVSRESNGLVSEDRQAYCITGKFLDSKFLEFSGEWQEEWSEGKKYIYDFYLDLSAP